MGNSILGVKVIGANGLTVKDNNSQIGNGSYLGARDFNSRSMVKSTRIGKKAGTFRPTHVVDDFSSFDAQILNLDDGSGYGYDQSSHYNQTMQSRKDHVINDIDSEEDDSQVNSE